MRTEPTCIKALNFIVYLYYTGTATISILCYIMFPCVAVLIKIVFTAEYDITYSCVLPVQLLRFNIVVLGHNEVETSLT